MILPLKHALVILSLSFLPAKVVIFIVRVALLLVLDVITLIVATADTGSTFVAIRSFGRIAHIAELSSRPVHVAALWTVPVVRIAEFTGAGRIMRRSGWLSISTVITIPGPRSWSGSWVGLRFAAQIASTAPGEVQVLAGAVRAVPVIVLHSEWPAVSTGNTVTRWHAGFDELEFSFWMCWLVPAEVYLTAKILDLLWGF